MSNFLSPFEGHVNHYPENLFLDTTLEAIKEANANVDVQNNPDGSALLVITFSNPFTVIHTQMSPDGKIYAKSEMALNILKARLEL